VRINICVCAACKTMSAQEAHNKQYFGPVYHGTSFGNQSSIDKDGFSIYVDKAGTGSVRNGFEQNNYPVHTLGYGIYFTEVKAVAQKFAGSKAKLNAYYLNANRIETINFGALSTISKWWVSNGFDTKLALVDQVAATKAMTKVLASKFDAVYLKGSGMNRGFDGNQICVYDTSLIYKIDESLSIGFELGAKVRRKSDGMIGVIKEKRIFDPKTMLDYALMRITELKNDDPFYNRLIAKIELYKALLTLREDEYYWYTITWKKGGTVVNNTILDFDTLESRKAHNYGL
jgi:hypothetical protein